MKRRTFGEKESRGKEGREPWRFVYNCFFFFLVFTPQFCACCQKHLVCVKFRPCCQIQRNRDVFVWSSKRESIVWGWNSVTGIEWVSEVFSLGGLWRSRCGFPLLQRGCGNLFRWVWRVHCGKSATQSEHTHGSKECASNFATRWWRGV